MTNPNSMRNPRDDDHEAPQDPAILAMANGLSWTECPPKTLKPGMVVRDDSGHIFLVGDINDQGSPCYCCPIPGEIVAYADIWDAMTAL